MTQRFLAYGRQYVDDDDIAAVVAALRSDYLTTGPVVAEYERDFCRASGALNAIACNSGTAALHLAMMAMGLGPGDCGIVPSITFLATANAIRMTGAEVVFADVDGGTGLMTPQTLDEAVSRSRAAGLSLKVCVPVHLNGKLCDVPALADLASRWQARIVEDACHALGIGDIGACRHSFAACFSTHPVKAITTCEGGVVTTRDAEAAHRMRSLRSHGMEREPERLQARDLATEDGSVVPWYYEMQALGWNYRLPDVLCALGRSQLAKLPAFQQRRRHLARLYDDLLAPLAPLVKPVHRDGSAHGWHIYAVQIDFAAAGVSRRKVMEYLRDKGIGSQVHYQPVHQQPYYRDRYGDMKLPGSEAYYARCLSLPFHPGLTEDDPARVVEALAGPLGRGSA